MKRTRTVDIAVVANRRVIALIERTKPPFQDKLVLPGGRVEPGETAVAAAIREAAEEIGLNLIESELTHLMVFEDSGRDPRGYAHSDVFLVEFDDEAELMKLVAGSDAKSIQIRSLNEVAYANLGFDHWQAIEAIKKRYAPPSLDIDDATLKARAAQMKPVITFNKDLYYIKPVDLRDVAFTWEPKRSQKAKNLFPIKIIPTYHTWGYYGFFKPSIAEVLAQIPEKYLNRVVAFQTLAPEGIESIVGEYHMASTILYARASDVT